MNISKNPAGRIASAQDPVLAPSSRYRISRAAVIGAGTMGGQIAATIAGGNTPVLLLDIVSRDNNDRDALAKKAIEKLKTDKDHGSEKRLALIQPGNIEDDLDKLENVDWVIECVPEEMEIKRDTYKKVSVHMSKHALISSNTSTIPLSELKKGLRGDVQKHLCITHFFNPPSKMPLLELVTDQDNDADAIDAFTRFADEKLGRNVVQAKDAPGFIANRIGMFWLLCAMEEARKEGLALETADAVMDGAFGFPKTGVFGLADLIGLKLIPDIADSMCHFLPKEDAFCQLVNGLVLIERRLQTEDEENTFYRKEGHTKKALDLNTGKYVAVKKTKIAARHWHEFLKKNTPESRFARNTLLRTLRYAADVSPAIASNILQVDTAMRDGYGWEYGPFEMMDRLGLAWLIERLGKQELHVPLLLKQAEAKGFYRLRDKGKEYLGFSGRYRMQKLEKNKWTLALKTADKKPILQNASAELHDIGDGIACFALMKGKMHVIDEEALDLLAQAVEKAESDFQGIIIGHDGKHFSAGLDLHIVTEAIESDDLDRIERILKQGQECMMNIKQSKVPVVAAIFGYALGGGCEMTLHCAAVQAHIDTHLGLVETGIGVIPAWGGTKEHLFRAAAKGSGDDSDTIIAQAVVSFRQIAGAKKSVNADEAFAMGVLTEPSRITMNRERLLPDAKALCLQIAKNYAPNTQQMIEVPVEALHHVLEQEVTAIIRQEHPGITWHRCKTLKTLAEVLSGHRAVKATERMGENAGSRAGCDKLTEQQILDSERSAFMDLLQSAEAPEAIKAALD